MSPKFACVYIKDIDVETLDDAVKVLAKPPQVIRTEGMVSADIVCLGSGMLPTALASCWETAYDSTTVTESLQLQHNHGMR